MLDIKKEKGQREREGQKNIVHFYQRSVGPSACLSVYTTQLDYVFFVLSQKGFVLKRK